MDRSHGQVENIEVDASHFGIGAHLLVLYAVADRLAQPEGEWTPFKREGWRRLAYLEPRRKPLLEALGANRKRP